MQVLVKLTAPGKLGEPPKSVTLRIESPGDEAELEIILGREWTQENPCNLLDDKIPVKSESKEVKSGNTKVLAPEEKTSDNLQVAGAMTEEKSPTNLDCTESRNEEPLEGTGEKQNAAHPETTGNPNVQKEPGNRTKLNTTMNQDDVTKSDESNKVEEKVKDANEEATISKLAEIASESYCFEEFLGKVATWLQLNNRFRDNFVMVCYAATKTQNRKKVWKDIEEVLEIRGQSVGNYDKIKISKQVTQVSGTTFLKLLSQISAYIAQKFPVLKEESPKSRKMLYMPQGFQQILDRVDKEGILTEQIEQILEDMGVYSQQIIDPTLAAVILEEAVLSERLKNLPDNSPEKEVDECLEEIISGDDTLQTRLEMINFVNSFIKATYPREKSVRLIEFLKEINIFFDK